MTGFVINFTGFVLNMTRFDDNESNGMAFMTVLNVSCFQNKCHEGFRH